MSDFKVSVYADANPYYFSSVVAGLIELEAAGRIDLAFSYPWSRNARKPQNSDVALWMEVEDCTKGVARSVVIDIQDQSYYFHPERLRACDVYFKRSFHAPDVRKFPEEDRGKVRPFGLHYLCRSRSDRALSRRVMAHYVSNYLRPQALYRSARQFYSSISLFRATHDCPFIDEFESSPATPLRPVVFFQTRAWTIRTSDEDLHAVNEERAALIRALKQHFGDRFIGGLAPSPIVHERYPDCITDQGTDRRSFIGHATKSLVRVYSRGLHHSIATKLPEYMAAAKCIVSEPIRNQLPVPPEKDTHYLEFRSPEECVEACQRLFDDPAFAQHMREENFRYYQAEVSPAARMWRCLNDVVTVPVS